jgi:hypothetical protein
MRLFLAIKAFFRILFSRDFGQQVLSLTDGTLENLKSKEEEAESLTARVEELSNELAQSQKEGAALTADLFTLSAAATSVKNDLEDSLAEIVAIRKADDEKQAKLNGELLTLQNQLEKSFEAVTLAQSNIERVLATSSNGPAILLSLLQREGRLIDFMMEEIKDFDDDQIGAAIRPVHAGCQKVFREYVKLAAIEKGNEGDRVTVKEGFDPSAIKLSGKVKGNPPFKGTLLHHGWIIEELNLPARPESHTPEVISPAEVEIG